jgi:hypothetical protein
MTILARFVPAYNPSSHAAEFKPSWLTDSLIGRPVSDISGVGWLPSTPAAPLYSMIDETAYDDADFDYASVSGISDLEVGISPSMAIGDHPVNLRAYTTSGTCQQRVRFKDSGGSSVGVTGYSTVTTTPTTFAMSVTLTGVATRAVIETIL